jgi:hypothetical protein
MSKPIEIQVNKDGQVWIIFRASEKRGKIREALVNLNNIVLGMHKEGITRAICIDALAIATQQEEDSKNER